MRLHFNAPVNTAHYRVFDVPAPNWFVMVDIGNDHSGAGLRHSYPSARAVVDDFGTLVIVRGWL
jgi:hypothetical protein